MRTFGTGTDGTLPTACRCTSATSTDIAATLALLTGNAWLRAILYFWTFALTTQALIQPHLNLGPAFVVFWAFWGAHTLIIACAVYDVVVLRFRPDWRDLGRACVASALYIAVVNIPIDLLLGANYGFVGNPPDSTKIPPFIAALGPWPWRVLIIFALALLAFILVLLPWLAARRLRLVELDAGFLYGGLPKARLVGQHRRELRRRQVSRLQPELGDARLQSRAP